MKVAVIIKRGHGAQDEGTHRVEAASTLEALKGVLGAIELGKKWKPGSYISCVAFVLNDAAEGTDLEFRSPAAQAGTTPETPTATADTLTCLSGPAVGDTLFSSSEEVAA